MPLSWLLCENRIAALNTDDYDHQSVPIAAKLSYKYVLYPTTVVGQSPGHLLPFDPLPVETCVATIGAWIY